MSIPRFPFFITFYPVHILHLLETVIIIAGKSEKGIRSLFDFIRICPIRLNIILNFRSCPASAEMLVDAGENPRYIGLLIIKKYILTERLDGIFHYDFCRKNRKSRKNLTGKIRRNKKKCHIFRDLENMAEATGLEPATSTVTGWHSNQLSYASAYEAENQ